MNTFIPEFNAHEVFVAPWTEHLAIFGWIGLMGFCVAGACGLVGNYLILRRMALIGDAVSHSVLPGLVIAEPGHAADVFGSAGGGRPDHRDH
jgi:manganese/zinc/iron transport system permease protein